MSKSRAVPAYVAVLNCWLAGMSAEDMAKAYPEFADPTATAIARRLMEQMNLTLHNTTLEPLPWRDNA